MNPDRQSEAYDEGPPIDDHPRRPLLMAIGPVLQRVEVFKEQAKDFYFKVLLSQYRCPACGGPLEMTGASQAACRACGEQLDPTLTFQISLCCAAPLARRQLHYACARCHGIVPSRFLFDERLFDADYFRERMAAHRQFQQRRREEALLRLAEFRSGELIPVEPPDLEAIPGLLADLDSFIGSGQASDNQWEAEQDQPFDLQCYRAHLLDQLKWSRRSFSSLSAITDPGRRDRAYRFAALLFMEQDGTVALAQNGPADIWVERVAHEAD